jgi:hypothetical protein
MAPAPREACIPGYRRRDPAETLLHRLLSDHVETFFAELDSIGHPGLPSFVKREVRAFLECGVLAHGFARVHCGACGRDSLVAFSCKGRGFCPSCGGRRMTATAAHLVDSVLPEAPIRQWVLSLPYALRLPCAFDPELLARVRQIFVRAVFSGTVRRARALGLEPGTLGFRSEAVNVVQRTGGALNLNPHFHALFVDGVYTRDSPLGPVRDHELPAPETSDVEWVLARVHSRLLRLFEKRAEERVGQDAERANELFTRLAAASIGGQSATGQEAGCPLPGLFAPEPEPSRDGHSGPHLVAKGAGFSLHAGVHVPADRRGRLEKLCRYIARPPLATERLSMDERGRILYSLRHPYQGKTHVVLTPRTLLERLCAMVPFPRRHLLTYHGVLAPASTWRGDIVPTPHQRRRNPAVSGASARSLGQSGYSWAELMKRAFEVDVLLCECGGRRDVIASITDLAVARRILSHLGLPDRPPSSAPPRLPPVLDFAASNPAD